jgi:hypothetical protein
VSSTILAEITAVHGVDPTFFLDSPLPAGRAVKRPGDQFQRLGAINPANGEVFTISPFLLRWVT